MTIKGKFYGIGVGPGDPQLITLKAVEVLKHVDSVAVPKSRMDRESVAWEIAKVHCPLNIRLMELEMPMTSDEEVLQAAWQNAATQILDVLHTGKSVAFLTLGDPSLYSTYTYLLNLLKKELTPGQIETVPGIMAMAAAAAKVNQPLATGDEPLLVLPGIEGVDKYPEIPNLVVMKVSRNLPEVLRNLRESGGRAVLATRVGQVGEEIRELTEQEEMGKVDYLSLVLINR
ncbi:precorrin-2 C(20)-methyltransferase [Desulfitobacterium sp.]|uniref:precorrin-2 C(20)-methyltransferase n=1 Tax=Desulfitobacterium sp. TaxID=49981 RepID=UPI002C1F7F48|nr:precorrin-2 C(20)-methyltransferase [Desulfitobacterium sp.]HVJ48298.1 precorrin-2 C(20)-methyltransferase [Desulfitobacterium sp.]